MRTIALGLIAMGICVFSLPLSALAVTPDKPTAAGNYSLHLAQAKPAAKPAAKPDQAKQAKPTQRRRVRRSFASLTCSVEANKKSLTGAKRKTYRRKCLQAASACSASAAKQKLTSRARAAFRKQCVTIAARRTQP